MVRICISLFPLQEDCLASAEHCYSMARLVALQLSVLQQSKQVINLEARGILTQMEELPFTEVRNSPCRYSHVWYPREHS